ncbi:MAG: DUF3380 domain-containing protein [Oxalobacteraceae bacterium]|nr:MAG: DUF3380 domain-containing protein [Oxalobacteraceae bacterium]
MVEGYVAGLGLALTRMSRPFAAAYNGAAYRKNAYDKNLAAAMR